MVTSPNRIELMSPLIAGYQDLTALAQAQARQQAQEEFMAIFYRELLKQAFKTPSFSLSAQEDDNNFPHAFTSDLMINQLATELAKNQAFSADELLKTQLTRSLLEP